MARPTLRIRNRIIAFHRAVGMSAALFVVVLAVTGLLINHEDRLGLPSMTIESRLLLDWYGIQPEGALLAFAIGGDADKGRRWVVGLERGVYLDESFFEINAPPMVGATIFGRMVVIASEDTLLLVTTGDDAHLIERLDSASLPGSILRLGRERASKQEESGFVVVETDTGFYRADPELIGWKRIDEPRAHWSRSGDPPVAVVDRALQRFRGQGLPLSRVVADIHSGKIFGSYGFLLMDAAALALLALTCTAIYTARRGWRQPPPGGGISI